MLNWFTYVDKDNNSVKYMYRDIFQYVNYLKIICLNKYLFKLSY